MKLVKQKHSQGCAPACLAMITGIDYDTVVEKSGINLEQGAYLWQCREYLRKKHYTSNNWFIYDRLEDVPKPWAALHLCNIIKDLKRKKGHLVVVYKGCRVYDPEQDVISNITDITDINLIVSVYTPYLMQPRNFSTLLGKSNENNRLSF